MNDAWIPLVSLAMGVGAFALCKVVERIIKRGRVPESMARWQTELEFAACDLMRSHLEVAAHQQRIADMIGRLPDSFEAPAFLAARLGVAIERAVLTEAERRGFYPAGTFRDIFATPAQAPEPNVPGRDETPEVVLVEQEQRAADVDAMLPHAVWVGDKLVPYSGNGPGPRN